MLLSVNLFLIRVLMFPLAGSGGMYTGYPGTPTESICDSTRSRTVSVSGRTGGRPPVPRIIKWARSNNCYECEEPFNLFVRRHHCRMCGNSFCHGTLHLIVPYCCSLRLTVCRLYVQNTQADVSRSSASDSMMSPCACAILASPNTTPALRKRRTPHQCATHTLAPSRYQPLRIRIPARLDHS